MPSPRPSGRGHGLEQTGHCGVPAECHQGCLCCVGPVWCPRPRVVSLSPCGVPVPVWCPCPHVQLCSAWPWGHGSGSPALPRVSVGCIDCICDSWGSILKLLRAPDSQAESIRLLVGAKGSTTAKEYCILRGRPRQGGIGPMTTFTAIFVILPAIVSLL